MTNEEKIEEMFPLYEDMEDYEVVQTIFKRKGAIEMVKWKYKQIAEAKELLSLCYNTILGITALDTPEEIAKARKSHDSSLIKRIELFMYNNQ